MAEFGAVLRAKLIDGDRGRLAWSQTWVLDLETERAAIAWQWLILELYLETRL